MVYVPALGKAIVSRNVLPGPMKRLFPSTVPSGLTIERSAKANVAFDACRLTRCPAAPGKVTRAFCPGAVVATETAAPPAVVLAAASGGTSNSCTVIEPVELASGATLTVYAPVTGSVVVSTNPPPPRAVSATGAPFTLAETETPPGVAQFAASAENDTGVPTSTAKPGPGESIQTCGVALHATAFPMLSLPPLLVVVANDGFGSTVPSSSAFRPTALADGK